MMPAMVRPFPTPAPSPATNQSGMRQGGVGTEVQRNLTDEKPSAFPTWQECLMLLRGVDDGLQLEGRQLAVVNHMLRNGEFVPDVWGLHTG